MRVISRFRETTRPQRFILMGLTAILVLLVVVAVITNMVRDPQRLESRTMSQSSSTSSVASTGQTTQVSSSVPKVVITQPSAGTETERRAVAAVNDAFLQTFNARTSLTSSVGANLFQAPTSELERAYNDALANLDMLEAKHKTLKRELQTYGDIGVSDNNEARYTAMVQYDNAVASWVSGVRSLLQSTRDCADNVRKNTDVRQLCQEKATRLYFGELAGVEQKVARAEGQFPSPNAFLLS